MSECTHDLVHAEVKICLRCGAHVPDFCGNFVRTTKVCLRSDSETAVCLAEKKLAEIRKQEKIYVILDIDNTLLESFNPSFLPILESNAPLPASESTPADDEYGVTHELRDSKKHLYGICSLRPGIINFLRSLAPLSEYFIVTAGTFDYGNAIIRLLNKVLGGEYFSDERILGREHTTESSKHVHRFFPITDPAHPLCPPLLIIDDFPAIWPAELRPFLIQWAPYCAVTTPACEAARDAEGSASRGIVSRAGCGLPGWCDQGSQAPWKFPKTQPVAPVMPSDKLEGDGKKQPEPMSLAAPAGAAPRYQPLPATRKGVPMPTVEVCAGETVATERLVREMHRLYYSGEKERPTEALATAARVLAGVKVRVLMPPPSNSHERKMLGWLGAEIWNNKDHLDEESDVLVVTPMHPDPTTIHERFKTKHTVAVAWVYYCYWLLKHIDENEFPPYFVPKLEAGAARPPEDDELNNK